MFYRFSISFVSLMLLALSSCKPQEIDKIYRKDCIDYGTCETAVSVKDFFVFRIGTWWVYEEQTTHERDSLYVTVGTNSESADFDTRIFSTKEQTYYHYFPQIINGSFCQPYTATHPDKRCLYVRKSKYSFVTNYLGEDICFYIQYLKGNKINTINQDYPDSKLVVKDVYPEYLLSGITYSRTVEMHEDHSRLENNQATNHFYARGVGLIRKELLDSNQVWNLVDYYIQP